MTSPQLPIPMPRQPELPWPAVLILGARRTKWSAWKGAHQACQICQMVCHERGVAAAPAPQPARMRRKGPGGGIVPADLFVCSGHGMELKRRDEEQDQKAAGVAQLDRVPMRR